MGAEDPLRVLDELTRGLNKVDWEKGQRCSRAVQMMGIQMIAPWDFPSGLRRLRVPPLCLFARGPAAVLYAGAEAVVGSRNASPGPVWWARRRAVMAAEAQRVIVSGGAHGIDSEAHRAAWGAGGTGIVVLGVAVDRVYPSSNKSLFAEIMRQGGAIVSEHPPLAPTFAFHHATRNRIIAGLSKRLWIAEAGKKSGTLHTGRAALQLGIPIGVPPPEIGGSRAGIDWLLEQSDEVSVVGPNRANGLVRNPV